MAEKRLDYFLENPELKSRHLRAQPTLEMYRFFPPEEEIITIDPSNPHKNYRYIFNGQPKTDFEKTKLSQFYEYESKNKNINYPSYWHESDTMRILQAVDYDIKKAYTNIIENIQWLESIPKTIDDKTIYILNSGFMYVHGRDHHFRPVIFCTIKKVKNLLSENYTFEDISRSIIYLMFLKFSLKAVIKMVNSVVKKSVILGSDELNKISELISQDNLEQKYGGKAPNVTAGGNNLFPPIMPNANYALNGERPNIVSPETYKNMCMGKNRPYVICPEYEKIWEEEKYNEEMNKKKKNEEKTEKIFLIQRNITANNEKVKNSTDMGFDKLNKNEFNKKRLLSDNKLFVKNDMDEIDEFLKEFEDINNLDSFEEKKYNTPTKINIQEINSFFEFIKQNPDFF